MACRFGDLRNKDVISVKDGSCLGVISDIEVSVPEAKIQAIVIRGRLKCCGLFGRENDIVIPWCNIKVIGEDTVLVDFGCPPRHKRRRRLNWSQLLDDGYKTE